MTLKLRNNLKYDQKMTVPGQIKRRKEALHCPFLSVSPAQYHRGWTELIVDGVSVCPSQDFLLRSFLHSSAFGFVTLDVKRALLLPCR